MWRDNASQIYKLCRVWSSDYESAMDLFQEVALKFCCFAPSFDRRKPTLPWLLAVVRNTAINQLRRSVRAVRIVKTEADVKSENDFVGNVADNVADYSVGGHYERMLQHELDFLMSDLDRSERLAIEYSFIGGYCLTDAGKIFGMTKSAFCKKRSKAFCKMVQKKNERAVLLKKKDAPPFILSDLLTQATEIS